jgi:hypothetical protein
VATSIQKKAPLAKTGVPGRPDGVASARSYRTSFAADEEPISEGGIWLNGRDEGVDWLNIVTEHGLAHGELGVPLVISERRAEQGDDIEAPEGDYNDPTAILTGPWGRNQHARARVFSKNQTDKRYHEVELRLRSILAPHRIPGYEVFFRCLKAEGGYAEIVRWEGPLGGWKSLCRKDGPEFGVEDGDTIEATIIGNVIKGYINGLEVTSAIDDTYPIGNPGIGFNYGGEDTYLDHGFTYYEVDTWDD